MTLTHLAGRIDVLAGRDPVQRQVMRGLHAADAELARLNELATMSGANAGEYRIVWRYRRGIGAWPEIA